ncbi:hypothetical protein, partial [Escherichia coli]|uniref:hypothetical protein n=1 Tax=Escherichia coli TaxID=562 RepID=UPI00197D7C1D
WVISLRQKQKKLIMLPSETMIWQPEFTDKTLSRKTGAVQIGHVNASSVALRDDELTLNEHFSICSNTNSVCITEGRGGKAYGLGILAKIWRPDSPPLRSRSRRLTLFNAVRKALSDNPSGLTLPIKKPKKTERIVTIVLPI